MQRDDTNSDSLSTVEGVKLRSQYLRGTLVEGLGDPVTGSISEDDNTLLKFHGAYQQDDRDLRLERQKQKLEPAYQFMVRARLPGGICTTAQWLALDELARSHANGTLRLTSRQTFQFHGVLKHRLRETIEGINRMLLTTLATCGDVNRNVMCHPNPHRSGAHAEVHGICARLSEHLLPRTRAYHEIWLGDEQVAGTPRADHEPLYGERYLPRKFKITVAVPPSNDVDVFAHDLGFIAIVHGQALVGFNVTIGGGMGMTHGDTTTYPRLADVLGFCNPDQVTEVAEAVIALQRDAGDRSERRHARFKYTVERLGVDGVRMELEHRLGWALAAPRPFRFTHTGDRLGWDRDSDGYSGFTIHVPSGRVADSPERRLMSGLRTIAETHAGDLRLTPNQNVIVCRIPADRRTQIADIIDEYRLDSADTHTAMHRGAMSCVAFPTCGLAMAESERFLPDLLSELDQVLRELGLQERSITLRMTGCPNGCVRPYLAEIGLVGKSPNRYNLYLGGSHTGERPNRLYREAVPADALCHVLRPVLERYAREARANEPFGDFVVRSGYVAAPRSGPAFHG